MSRKIEFTVEADGEEKDAFIKLSSSVEKAAVSKAFDEGISPVAALSDLTGLSEDLIKASEEQ